MLRYLRLYLGISLFWLPLSLLTDGLNTLILPNRLAALVPGVRQATVLGLATFIGLLAAMLVQPVAGTISDRLRVRWGRRGFLGLGVFLILVSLGFLGLIPGLTGAFLGYLLVQVSASIAQAGQQGFLPDLVPVERRGTASGLKGFMDLVGAMLGFVLLGQLLGSGQRGLALLAAAVAVLIAFLLTVVLVREPRPEQAADSGSRDWLVPLGQAFHFDYARHRSFAWLVLARFLFLLGTYAVGRFLVFFVADRLGMKPDQASEQAGTLLAGLALLTALAALPAGWAADHFGRTKMMAIGSLISAAGVLLLIIAGSAETIFIFGGLMAIGSAAFAGANWAYTADLAPPQEAGRFFALANLGTAGAAAVAGLLGPLVDWAEAAKPGAGYPALFAAAALAFVASLIAVRAVRPAPLPTPSPEGQQARLVKADDG